MNASLHFPRSLPYSSLDSSKLTFVDQNLSKDPESWMSTLKRKNASVIQVLSANGFYTCGLLISFTYGEEEAWVGPLSLTKDGYLAKLTPILI